MPPSPSLQSISSHDSDEIVLSFEDSDNDDDDDFVFLDMPCRRDSGPSDTASAEQPLVGGIPKLEIAEEATEVATPPPPSPSSLDGNGSTPTKKRRPRKAARKTVGPEASSDSKQPQKGKAKKRSRGQRKKANKTAISPTKCATGAGATEIAEEMYKEASDFITSFLANPAANSDSACRLTLLQSLIVELGLASTALPTSLRSARAFLKARVFINIREYLAHRGKDQAALLKLLYPSKTALVKDIKRKRIFASRKWVKKHGLQVLLVECLHYQSSV